MVSLDFGESYTVVIQRSAQSNYFNGTQITIHPFVSTFNQHEEEKTDVFVIISDHSDHSTAAVHVFQKHLINHFQNTLQYKVINYLISS
jgi:hypothetical protein